MVQYLAVRRERYRFSHVFGESPWQSPFNLRTMGMLALLLLLVSACALPSQARDASLTPSPTPTTRVTEKMTPTQTSCPSVDKARTIGRAYLARGKSDTLIYFDNTTAKTLLMRYDASTRKTTTALTLPKTQITNMQVSSDGQWVLFVARTKSAMYPNTNYVQPYSGTTMLQAVRVDGQGLQTLYCSQRGEYMEAVSWSPDGKQIAFQQTNTTSHFGKYTIGTRVLNTGDGSMYIANPRQIENSTGDYFKPLTWIDNTHLALVHTFDRAPGVAVPSAAGIYLLDTAHKHVYGSSKRFPQLVSEDFPICWSTALAPDRHVLYQSTSPQDRNGYENQGVSRIGSYSLTGEKARTVFSNALSPMFAITRIVAATSTSIFFQAWEGEGMPGIVDSSQIWRVNLDGSGLTRAFAMNNVQYGIDHTTPWGDLSRSERWLANLSSADGNYSNGSMTNTMSILSPETNTVVTTLATYKTSMLYLAGPFAIAGWTQL